MVDYPTRYEKFEESVWRLKDAKKNLAAVDEPAHKSELGYTPEQDKMFWASCVQSELDYLTRGVVGVRI